ncbi:MAG: response regulator [Lachnospiraceae bacterium]|uniref:Stage 0 sporulation protein A homolog n=1 Tax=Hominiventricola filiformis TaxID=2885352 RepID=A0AAE3A9T3_9FIRM|nr:response regulator [Hominiventricola filiformis]MCI6880107.1 response regulator [Clostridiaceae bacterium]MDY3825036.1 response regulator [Lachnospiraceae bacterium]QUO21378.1 response regulator [Clostridiaceae bacterium Marseille-Q4143]RHU84235.1 response regulator [Clostridiaceae bacterium OM08-6BH]MCC2127077.1 response regulator [Hominiventricola filiformis]
MDNNRYSVLLVDDEEDIIRIIMKKLDWESMGLTIIGHAANGVEALEMAEELTPDIVMTDIKMPYMDGLTLCRKLKELSRTIRVIIFSGFDEFEYAKEAIKMEAEEYLLKPVNAVELKEVFERVKNDLDQERAEKRDTEKLKSYYMESLPVLQESLYMALLEGRITSGQIYKYMDTYQIRLPGPYYVVTVLHLSSQSVEENGMDPFLMAMSVQKYAEEQTDRRWRSRFLIYLGDIIMISQLSDKEEMLEYTNDLDRLCRMGNRVLNVRITAGIGYLCNNLEQIPLSYQGAKQAVSYRVLYGNTRAISIADVEPAERVEMNWEDAYSSYIQQIIKKVRVGEQQGLEDAIAEFTGWLSGAQLSMQQYRVVLMDLLAELFRFISSHQLNMEEIFGSSQDVYTKVLQLESAEALGSWLVKICRNLQKAVTFERQDTTKVFVQNAVEYVKEHYADQDLSVEVICKKLNVSSAYFSTIFKKETGKTFVRFLTDYRMEQAVSLLMTGNDKTYMIAEKVGYAEPNYFSYVFKKQYGMSPSKYKADRLEQK